MVKLDKKFNKDLVSSSSSYSDGEKISAAHELSEQFENDGKEFRKKVRSF
jgi:hypothetical protein